MGSKMKNQNKLKIAAATLGIAVIATAIAILTALALRDDDAVIEESVIAAQTQSLPVPDGANSAAESIGIPEPLFIAGEPVTVFDGETKVLSDGTVSISNPDVEPMPDPLEPAVEPLPHTGIAVGEPNPSAPEPRLASPDWIDETATGQAPSVAPALPPTGPSEPPEAPKQ